MPDTPATPPKPRAKAPAKSKAVAKKPAVKKAAAPKPATPKPAAPKPAGDAAQPSWVKVGVGVGSAALVAALLYATRSKRNDWTK